MPNTSCVIYSKSNAAVGAAPVAISLRHPCRVVAGICTAEQMHEIYDGAFYRASSSTLPSIAEVSLSRYEASSIDVCPIAPATSSRHNLAGLRLAGTIFDSSILWALLALVVCIYAKRTNGSKKATSSCEPKEHIYTKLLRINNTLDRSCPLLVIGMGEKPNLDQARDYVRP